MVKHLDTINHPFGPTLKKLVQERMTFEWQKRNNIDDSVVYTMRHMETYMGDPRSWRPGFEVNESKQEAKVTDLRAKYVSKLLLSQLNERKDFVNKQYRKFFTKTEEIRKNMLEQARITRWERLNPYEAKYGK